MPGIGPVEGHIFGQLEPGHAEVATARIALYQERAVRRAHPAAELPGDRPVLAGELGEPGQDDRRRPSRALGP